MFEVSLEGLSKLIEDQGPSRLIGELIRNSLDEDGVTEVKITLEPVEGRQLIKVCVEDDNKFAWFLDDSSIDRWVSIGPKCLEDL